MRTLTARLKGEQPGPEASIRKMLGDEHGQHVMALARDLIGAAGMLPVAWPAGGRQAPTSKDLAPGRPPADARSPGLVRRLPVLPGADDRRRHGRGAAQHRRRAGARPPARRRRSAGLELGGGTAWRTAWLISSPPPRRSPRWSPPGADDGREQARRLPAETVDALVAADLMRMGLAAAYGGPEADPLTMLTAIEILSSADGAAGWCSMIASTTSTQSLFLQPSAAREIYRRADDGHRRRVRADRSRRRRGRRRRSSPGGGSGGAAPSTASGSSAARCATTTRSGCAGSRPTR